MPVSQGSGGYMPGMTLRAWAVVSAAGALLKSSGVASVAKGGPGEYILTLTGAAVAATAFVKGTHRGGYCMEVNGVSISGNTFTYRCAESIAGNPMDTLAHVEIYE